MNLHILTKPNIPETVLNSTVEDDILLLNEAVYLVLQPQAATIFKRKTYILADDWNARGGANWQVPDNAQLITYPDFVMLCAQHQTSITW